MNRRDDDRRPVDDEADVADESLVENRVDGIAIVDAARGKPLDRGAVALQSGRHRVSSFVRVTLIADA